MSHFTPNSSVSILEEEGRKNLIILISFSAQDLSLEKQKSFRDSHNIVLAGNTIVLILQPPPYDMGMNTQC